MTPLGGTPPTSLGATVLPHVQGRLQWQEDSVSQKTR